MPATEPDLAPSDLKAGEPTAEAVDGHEQPKGQDKQINLDQDGSPTTDCGCSLHASESSTPHSDTRATSVHSGDHDGQDGLSSTQEPEGRDESYGPSEKTTDTPEDVDYPPLQSMPDHGDHHHHHIKPWTAGGVRFAPLRIPFPRRMQTATVFWHCITCGTCVSVFLLMCSIPMLWPIIIIYAIHLYMSTWGRDGHLRLRSETFRSLKMWKWFASYFPMRLHKTHDLSPTRKYIMGYHPHGIIAQGAWAAFGTNALGFDKLFPGITNSLLTLDSNFSVPLYREYILAGGVSSVSKESITNLLTHGGPNNEGMGRAVTIVVGGARESLQAQPGTMRLILDERKGFVKLAIRLGADLVPVLSFGENDLYEQLDPKTYPRVAAFQKMLLKWLKFTIPMIQGRGVLNYDVGLMPHRRPINIVVGKPITVVMPVGEPDQAEIDKLHAEYVAELQRIWDTYKDQFAPHRKAEFEIVG